MNCSIIQLHLDELSTVFLIWGQDNFEDSFLLDKKNRICGFLSLKSIKHFIDDQNADFFPFGKEELNYKDLFSNEINTYSFITVNNILLKNKEIEEIEAYDAGILIEVYNLISDYFYQTNNEECLSLKKDKNMAMFFDYCYYKYFWKRGNDWLALQKELPSFDYAEFAKIFKKLLCIFAKSIKIVQI